MKAVDLRKPDISDQDLVSKSAAGDTDSFRLLYRRYLPKVRSTLFRLSGDIRLNDLTQEVFIKVWLALPNLKTHETFSAWIYRIAMNVAQDELRQRARNPFHPITDDPPASKDHARDLELSQLVELVLLNLDFAHRSVLVLHELEGLTEQEVAEALDIPLGTVKSRLFHARAKARALLAAKGVKL